MKIVTTCEAAANKRSLFDPSANVDDSTHRFHEWEHNYAAFAISVAARGLYSLLLVVGVNLSDVRRSRTLGLLQRIDPAVRATQAAR